MYGNVQQRSECVGEQIVNICKACGDVRGNVAFDIKLDVTAWKGENDETAKKTDKGAKNTFGQEWI